MCRMYLNESCSETLVTQQKYYHLKTDCKIKNAYVCVSETARSLNSSVELLLVTE